MGNSHSASIRRSFHLRTTVTASRSGGGGWRLLARNLPADLARRVVGLREVCSWVPERLRCLKCAPRCGPSPQVSGANIPALAGDGAFAALYTSRRNRQNGCSSGRLAQLVRALASHARGHRFKSCIAHHSDVPRWRNGRRAVFRAQCPYGRESSNLSLGTNHIHRWSY